MLNWNLQPSLDIMLPIIVGRGTWCFSSWKTWGPFMFSEQRMANTPVETDGIISLMCIKPGAHVLNLCCGVG